MWGKGGIYGEMGRGGDGGEQFDQCVVLLCVALVVLCHFICLKGVSLSKDDSGGRGEFSGAAKERAERCVGELLF